MTDELPKLVSGHKVDLKKGEIVVIVEVFKVNLEMISSVRSTTLTKRRNGCWSQSIMGVSVLEDYDTLKRYNVQELVNQYNQEKGGATGAGRVATVANVKLVPAAAAATATVECAHATGAGIIDQRVENQEGKILGGAIEKVGSKTEPPVDHAATILHASKISTNSDSSHATPAPEQPATTFSVRHLLPPKPSPQVVAASNQTVGQTPKGKTEKKTTVVQLEKKETGDKSTEAEEKAGNLPVQRKQGKEQSSQEVQPQLQHAQLVQHAQHAQHAQQNERHQHGQPVQHSQAQQMQYQAQLPPQTHSQHQSVPIAPWLVQHQQPGYPQQPLGFAPSHAVATGAYMDMLIPRYGYGQEQAGPSNIRTAYPPGFPQHAMFQSGHAIPTLPPPVPYASRPGTMPSTTLPVTEEEMGKRKVKPAWKRGEPVKRDRRGRCWHCGADRAHAADDVVERVGTVTDAGKRSAREDRRDVRDVKRVKR